MTLISRFLSAVKDVAALLSHIQKLESLLEVAACPSNCKNGAIPYQTSPGVWEAEQCQFCYERSELLKTDEKSID